MIGDGRRRRSCGEASCSARPTRQRREGDVLIDGKRSARSRPHRRRRCRSGRLFGHDRHARFHHDAQSPVRESSAPVIGRTLARRGVRRMGRWCEHLDAGRIAGPGARGPVTSGPGALSAIPRPVSQADQNLSQISGRDVWNRYVAGQSQPGPHGRDDQGAHRFRPQDAVRLQRRDQSGDEGPFEFPGR